MRTELYRWFCGGIGVVCGAALVQAAAPRPAPRPTQAKPLMIGNWADPSILKDGEDYYLTHSSFQYQPGLLVWHSKDLRSWKPIARAVTNQLGSIWAPDLVKHQNRYYIYYPASGGNYVVSADSPKGPWSKPESVGAPFIDPGHVADAEGKRYLHLSGGHIVELDAAGLRATSRPKKIYDGWPIPQDWAIECFCLESPKLMHHQGWYYLTSAQGGTAGPATSHMVVSARSRLASGPWENSPYNPIIRTWSRDEMWWSKGHGTLVEGPDSQWYCVLHGYLSSYPTLGRCTIIEPISWTTDDWFVATPDWPASWEKPAAVEMPMTDEFNGQELGIQWQFYQRFDPNRFAFNDGALELKALGTHAGDSLPLCLMPLHWAYQIETEVELEGEATAGLMLFFSPEVYIGLGLSEQEGVQRVSKSFRDERADSLGKPAKRRVVLRIVNNCEDVRFYAQDPQGEWRIQQPSVNISGAHHNALGGWHAVRPALFASGKGKARFHYFSYKPL